jgi:hypothetical protein
LNIFVLVMVWKKMKSKKLNFLEINSCCTRIKNRNKEKYECLNKMTEVSYIESDKNILSKKNLEDLSIVTRFSFENAIIFIVFIGLLVLSYNLLNPLLNKLVSLAI